MFLRVLFALYQFYLVLMFVSYFLKDYDVLAFLEYKHVFNSLDRRKEGNLPESDRFGHFADRSARSKTDKRTFCQNRIDSTLVRIDPPGIFCYVFYYKNAIVLEKL